MTLQEQIKQAINDGNLELARKLLEEREQELAKKEQEQITDYRGSSIIKNKQINVFNDDGTEAITDKEIDQKLWKGRKPSPRVRNAATYIQHPCAKCGKTFDILPSQLTGIDKKKFICNACGANP